MDNVTPESSALDIIAADEIAGVKYQRVKVVTGSDGVAIGDVSDANPMPVKVIADTSVLLTTLNNVVLSSFGGMVLNNVSSFSRFTVVLGTTTNTPTFQLYGTLDGTNWYKIGCEMKSGGSNVHGVFINEHAIKVKLELVGSSTDTISLIQVAAS